jgi:hypothetical protein
VGSVDAAAGDATVSGMAGGGPAHQESGTGDSEVSIIE